jgi:hypothetical protein
MFKSEYYVLGTSSIVAAFSDKGGVCKVGDCILIIRRQLPPRWFY